jgi:hypothetical protein
MHRIFVSLALLLVLASTALMAAQPPQKPPERKFRLIPVEETDLAPDRSDYTIPGTYRCVDRNGRGSYTSAKEEMVGKRCVRIKRTVDEEIEELKQKQARQAELDGFRAALKRGDYTNRGLVVDIKRPVVQIQEPNGLRWYRIDELTP